MWKSFYSLVLGCSSLSRMLSGRIKRCGLCNAQSQHHIYSFLPQSLAPEEIYIMSRPQHIIVLNPHHHKTSVFHLHFSVRALCQKRENQPFLRRRQLKPWRLCDFIFTMLVSAHFARNFPWALMRHDGTWWGMIRHIPVTSGSYSIFQPTPRKLQTANCNR